MVWICWKDVYVLLGEIQKTCFWGRRLSSFVKVTFIYEHWLVITTGDLAAVVFVSNKFMSSCVICVVIARGILLQSDCPEITKVHNKFKKNDKNGNFTFKCCWWSVGVCSVPSECLSAKIGYSWSSDKFAKRTTCEFFLIRLYFCCLLDQDLKGQCR